MRFAVRSSFRTGIVIPVITREVAGLLGPYGRSLPDRASGSLQLLGVFLEVSPIRADQASLSCDRALSDRNPLNKNNNNDDDPRGKLGLLEYLGLCWRFTGKVMN